MIGNSVRTEHAHLRAPPPAKKRKTLQRPPVTSQISFACPAVNELRHISVWHSQIAIFDNAGRGNLIIAMLHCKGKSRRRAGYLRTKTTVHGIAPLLSMANVIAAATCGSATHERVMAWPVRGFLTVTKERLKELCEYPHVAPKPHFATKPVSLGLYSLGCGNSVERLNA